jgi:hypothetical protein
MSVDLRNRAVDLLTTGGADSATARDIAAHTPTDALTALLRLPGTPGHVVAQLRDGAVEDVAAALNLHGDPDLALAIRDRLAFRGTR